MDDAPKRPTYEEVMRWLSSHEMDEFPLVAGFTNWDELLEASHPLGIRVIYDPDTNSVLDDVEEYITRRPRRTLGYAAWRTSDNFGAYYISFHATWHGAYQALIASRDPRSVDAEVVEEFRKDGE